MTSLRVVLTLLALAGSAALAADPYRRPPDEGVYYEIFVRSFQDSDGDGIGDLRGIVERLDHLAALGVTGLWLTPIHPSPSYHGYDVTDYEGIHPELGTLEDFEALVEAAHARGMRVLLDLVVNHTSDQHPWFRRSRIGDPAYRDRYVWRRDPAPLIGTGGGSAWHRAGDAHYLGLFWGGMPDLNLLDPATREEIYRIVDLWLARGVDGFRVDAIQHLVEGPDGAIANAPLNLDLVRALDARVRAAKPGAFVVGETWTGPAIIAAYYREAALDMAFDYPLWGALIGSVSRRSPTDLAAVLEAAERLYPEDAWRATFLANHDQTRPATSLAFLRPDPGRLRLAAGLLLTLPGTPFLYYGEEIGMPSGPGGRHEDHRTPMRWDGSPGAGFTTGRPWQAFSTDDPAVSVAGQEGDPDSLLSWYRRLIRLRLEHPALLRGDLALIDEPFLPSKLFAVERAADGERVLVLASFDTRELEIDLASLGRGAPGSIDLLTGERVGDTLRLERMGLAILRVE